MGSGADKVPPRRPNLWRSPTFLRFWLGQSISLLGSRVSELAIPLTAVLVLNAGPAEMGLLGSTLPLAWLLVGLFAGVWVDRLPRRPIMIVADVGRVVLLASIPAAWMLGWLHGLDGVAFLCAVSFLSGVLTVFFTISYQSFVPSLVHRQQLIDANSKLEASKSLAEILGPGLGGALVQLITAPLALLADAFSYVVSGISLALVNVTEKQRMAPRGQRKMFADIGEGLRTVFHSPVLRSLALFMGTAQLFLTMITTLYALYVVRDLNLGPHVLGAILTVGSCGALPGALLADWTVRKIGLGRTVIGAAFLAGGANLLIPLASGTDIMIVAVLVSSQAIFAFVITMANINLVSLRQAITPDRLLGRVNATQRVIVSGLPLVGAGLAGVLGETIGIRNALLVGACGQLAAAMWLVLSPVRRMREQPAHEEQALLDAGTTPS